jgi:hypothetical protein
MPFRRRRIFNRLLDAAKPYLGDLAVRAASFAQHSGVPAALAERGLHSVLDYISDYNPHTTNPTFGYAPVEDKPVQRSIYSYKAELDKAQRDRAAGKRQQYESFAHPALKTDSHHMPPRQTMAALSPYSAGDSVYKNRRGRQKHTIGAMKVGMDPAVPMQQVNAHVYLKDEERHPKVRLTAPRKKKSSSKRSGAKREVAVIV